MESHALYINGKIALPPIDEDLKQQYGENATEFLSHFTFVPEMKKKIE